MKQHQSWLVLVIVLALVMRDSASWVIACCPAFARGTMFQIADQRILVAWDPKTKVEHFVREAGFKRPRLPTPVASQPATVDSANSNQESMATKRDQDFGFLVPTPTQPQIESSDGSVFTRLVERIAPRIERVQKWEVSPMPLLLAPFLLMSSKETTSRAPNAAAPMDSVKVLETKQVAGYEVAVLKASDAGALADWLKAHDYESRPALQQWAEPYVAKGWIITAFKYAAAAGRIEAGAVRMSFVTDQPIFPYRVPTDQLAEENQRNLLQTHVIGPGRAQGQLGEGPDSRPWAQARLRYAQRLSADDLRALLGTSLASESIDALTDSWLTTYDDRTWPSGTEDLSFQFDSSAQQYQEVQRVIVRRVLPMPLDVIFFVGIAGTLLIRRRLRKTL